MKFPVEEIASELTAPFEQGAAKRILLKAPTGSGKSTIVPSLLLDEGIEGLVVVIQPRRIAARMLANRVASLRNTRVGGEVGYSVRFDTKKSEATRILFVTDGIFQNWIERDPELTGIGCVIFDEFHERRIASDVGLALTMAQQLEKRPDLSVVVMSATLEMGNLAGFMEPCREIEAGGRTFPVEISYQAAQPVQSRSGRQEREAIWETCFKSAAKATLEDDAGDILIFLPGVHEIRKTVSLLESSSHFRKWDVLPLYSALPPKQQDLAVSPSDKPKIIVSTNVAETSLTIDGVRTVIDAGLARISEFDPDRGIETLLVKNIAQSAADQRAGRAGRTAPGKCIRLWSNNSHAKRRKFEQPEIRRTDVAELMLSFAAAGRDVETFHWLDAPLPESTQSAKKVLKMLDAIDAEGKVTELGQKMASVTLPPRFSRLIFAGDEEGCVAETCFIAAAIQGEGVFTKRKGAIGRKDFIYETDDSDFAGEYRAYEAAEAVDFDPKRCGSMGILARGAREVKMAYQQLLGVVESLGLEVGKIRFDKRGKEVTSAMLKSFGDRIGRRYNENTLAAKLCDGRKGQVDPDSVAKSHPLFIPTEITEIDGRDVVVKFNRCVGLSLELLQEKFSHALEEGESVEYDSVSRRVNQTKVTRFKGIVIDERPGGTPDPDMASHLLAQKVAEGELVLNEWNKQVDAFIARFLSLREWMPELELPDFTDEDKAVALAQVCEGATSYKEIKNREVLPAVRSWLSTPQHAALNSYAPTEIKLQNGKSTKVYYEAGKKPWIAMRAQLLFGVKSTPTIANGTVKLNVHICAPNNRAWQITDDLENFWANGFAQMAKDLGGRYPKHQWTLD